MAPHLNIKTANSALRVAFSDHLVVMGGPCTAEWDDDVWDMPYEMPDLGGHDVWWWLSFGGKPLWERYCSGERASGRPLTSRAKAIQDCFASPCTWLSIPPFDTPRLEVQLVAAPGLGLEHLLVSTVTSGSDLFMQVPVAFSNNEGVPAPTTEGFAERHEPMFGSDRPTFSFQPLWRA